FKGTSVDGVYTADPKKDPGARRYERLTYHDVLAQDLLDHFGACDEHLADVFDHHHKVCHGRRIHRAAGTRADACGYLRDDA
ncbi:MAG: hypothetical protein HXY31_05675, partial [Nitrososphaera sp.]|nr:hypothetical protein [Nitrososphaera sp.]